MNTCKINGITVNAEAIGQGIYSMICERGEESIVAFGMIPKWAMDIVNRQLREKVVTLAANGYGATRAEIEACGLRVDEKKLTDTVNAIEHEICVSIYQAASKAGKMVV